jgi:hypothetical protein
MSVKVLRVVRDTDRNVVIGMNQSVHIDARVLAANTAESHIVPSGARYVLFSANADFYAKFGSAASVPAGDVTDGSASELNPTLRSIDGAASIGLISPTACYVTLSFYA